METIKKQLTLALLTASLVLPMRCFAVDYSGGMTELMQAVNDSSATRTFTATGILAATSGLGTMSGAGSVLTLNGGNYSLNGGGAFSGLTVNSEQTLNINSFGSLNGDGTVNTSISNFTSVNGGFINNAGSTSITNSVFDNNLSTNIGGVVYNTGVLNVTGSTFNNNRSTMGYGGAIQNNGGTLVVENSSFYRNAALDDGGGAIWNVGGGNLTIRNSTFTENTGTNGCGGAIQNALGSTATIINSTFTRNSTITNNTGGAVENRGTMTISGSTFTENTTPGNGGAINNGGTHGEVGTLTVINSVLSYNTATTNGGAIYSRNAGTITTIDHSIFKGNNALLSGGGGGAICNSNGAKTIIFDTIFGGTEVGEGNKAIAALGNGGAILNWDAGSIVEITRGTFIGNTSGAFGGAIDNRASLTIVDSSFIGNITHSGFDPKYGGGAIFNWGGVATITGSTFEGNNAINGVGGALHNCGGGTTTITNSVFTGNIAKTLGGAIYNSDTLNIIANNGSTTFTGNTDSTGSNAIYLDAGKLNLNAGNNGTITFNDKITSGNINNIINVNKTGSTTAGEPPVSAPTNGSVVFNNVVSNSTINLYAGTMALGNDSYLNGNNITLNGGTLNMMNNAVGVANFNNLTLSNTTNLAIDANLANSTVDKITSTNPFTGTGILNISNVRVISDAADVSSIVNFADSSLRGQVTMTATEALTPIYKYGITYDSSTGNLNFSRSTISQPQNFNPAVLSTPVASIAGAFANQATVYNEALGRMDALMLLPETDRLLMRYRNKTASADGQFVFSPTLLPEESSGTWVKQYTSFENIPLNNGPNISNVGYGLLIGKDSALTHLKNGYDGYLTAYTGYNGSHQNYDQVGVFQSGGVLGLTGTVYKGKFFSALTANVGANAGNAYTMYGTDNFTTLVAGLANKTGYNFEFLHGKMIIQPSLMTSYTFANTFDYTTASGVNITSNPLNAFQIMPGLKLIGNLKDGWQPYLGLSMVWNIMDRQKFYANDVQLPQMSVNPYVEYGIGLQRRWGDRFTGFGQAMARGGGRNGLALQFGFRWAF